MAFVFSIFWDFICGNKQTKITLEPKTKAFLLGEILYSFPAVANYVNWHECRGDKHIWVFDVISQICVIKAHLKWQKHLRIAQLNDKDAFWVPWFTGDVSKMEKGGSWDFKVWEWGKHLDRECRSLWPYASRSLSHRPSDRVWGCGTAQFGQTRTITHNPRKLAKSRTIWKCLLEILIKMGISIEYQDF